MQPDLSGQLPKPELQPNGIARRLLDNEGCVIPNVWMAAIASGGSIGTCRHCGGSLIPLTPLHVSQSRTDYEAECENGDRIDFRQGGGMRAVPCGYSVVFPSGRSGRWDDTQKRGRRRPLLRGEKAITSNVPSYLQTDE